ncbi:MAG: hypothetical protein MUO76_22115, partial [Anaerolineaceae bacterium]|nr:hypothetical protein [Anaerolineaceae bacterium]
EGIRRTVEIIHRLDPTASIVLDQSYACDWDSRWHIQQLIDFGIEFDQLILQFQYNSYPNPLVSDQHNARFSLAEQSRCIDVYADLLEPYGVTIGPTDPYFSSVGPPNSPGYWGHPWSENLQAQYLEVINTIFFSKPMITILGYQQPVGHPAHCMVEGGIVDKYGMPLKAYWVLQDLMQRWKTSGETVTDNTGSIAFHGFAGLYSFEICNPDSMDCMHAEVELEGEGSSELTIVFEPNDMLAPLREQLVTLRDYWQDRGDSAKTQHADDLLALVDYHRDRHEWDMAQQVIAAGLKELVIETRLRITPDMLRTAGWSHGGFERLPENQLFLNGNTTVYYPYNFPPGEVEVRVTARYRNDDIPQEPPGKASAGSEWPNMIIGADANYSEWLQVNDRELQVYSAVLPLQGTEEVLSIHNNMDHDDYQSAGFIITDIEIIIRSSQPQATPLINRPPVITDSDVNILEYLLLNEQEPKSTFILDQQESDQGTGRLAASLEMDTPFTVRLNIDGKGDEHWVDLYSNQGEAGMYIGSWDRSGVVLIFYDERGDEYSVGYPLIDIVRWGEPFSIEFLDPQGKSFIIRNNENQVAARVNITQFEDLHLSGGLFPNGKINVGIIVGPGSSLMIRELLFEFDED